MAATSAAAMVITRLVSPSKLELTRWPGRGSRRVATIGPIAQLPEFTSTSTTSDQPVAMMAPMVAAWRRRPALP